jgi:death-on-curing protein
VKRSAVRFLTFEAVLAIHDRQFVYGGLPGLRDAGLLASAVAAPEVGYYFTLAQMAAVYAHGIAKNHAFVDANKRTALASAGVFLRMNGEPVRFTRASEDLMVAVAAGLAGRGSLRMHLIELMGGDVEVDDED